MQTQTDKPPPSLRLILAAVVMLLSTGAFAALMAWKPSTGASRDTLPLLPVERAKPRTVIDAGTLPLRGHARNKVKCGECGSIVSIRETARHNEAPIPADKSAARNRNGTPVKSTSREITVRLEDGSSRVITGANPGTWRIGERVKVIDGFGGPGA
ncbi:MAG TPA: hypothetical protein VK572_04160 [Burkholderiales bacterium]|nr:hypothetical protein [Burkholderiales bacterium]